jgi:hypothetical protein
MIRAILNGKDYLYALRFCSNEETRYYLKGVSIEPLADNSLMMVATDGKVLGALRLSYPEGMGFGAGEKFILADNKDLRRICKAKRNEEAWIVCHTDKVEVYLCKGFHPDISDFSNDSIAGCVAITIPASAAYIDGSFPEWRKVIPSYNKPDSFKREGTFDTGKPFCVGVDPDQLARFQYDENPGVYFDWNGTNAALVVNRDPRFIGIIMPMCDGIDRDGIAARCQEVLTMPENKADVAA